MFLFTSVFVIFTFLAVSMGEKPKNDANLDVTILPEKLSGTFRSSRGLISFIARIEVNLISSSTMFKSKEINFDTSLVFQYTDKPKVAGMTEHMVTAAKKLSAETNCRIPPKMSSIYEEFSEALLKHTISLGGSQLRFSLMYHVSIIGSSERVCLDKKPLCTPSPAYEFGDELFVCIEDINDIFPHD